MDITKGIRMIRWGKVSKNERPTPLFFYKNINNYSMITPTTKLRGFVETGERTEEGLRNAGWFTAENLTSLGYHWTGNDQNEPNLTQMNNIIDSYYEYLMSTLSGALRDPMDKISKEKWSRYEYLTDTYANNMTELLIKQIGDVYFVSPDAVEMMELEGHIAKREKAVGKTWASQESKKEPPSPNPITPDSNRIQERKGQSIE